ncbi:hypothetical protein NC981_14135 [Leptolyngbya sp. DQ-M1]|uniref:hypothetical protein n=1 Tax=Leptolyngbya sp. DQ-M1 TaxID=2933920 RepID=UPI003299AF71
MTRSLFFVVFLPVPSASSTRIKLLWLLPITATLAHKVGQIVTLAVKNPISKSRAIPNATAREALIALKLTIADLKSATATSMGIEISAVPVLTALIGVAQTQAVKDATNAKKEVLIVPETTIDDLRSAIVLEMISMESGADGILIVRGANSTENEESGISIAPTAKDAASIVQKANSTENEESGISIAPAVKDVVLIVRKANSTGNEENGTLIAPIVKNAASIVRKANSMENEENGTLIAPAVKDAASIAPEANLTGNEENGTLIAPMVKDAASIAPEANLTESGSLIVLEMTAVRDLRNAIASLPASLTI